LGRTRRVSNPRPSTATRVVDMLMEVPGRTTSRGFPAGIHREISLFNYALEPAQELSSRTLCSSLHRNAVIFGV